MDTEIVVGLFTLGGTLLGYLANYGVERLRAKNDKSNHVSKIRFDKEFEIYQELSEKNMSMVFAAGTALLICRYQKSLRNGTLLSDFEDPKQQILNMVNEHKELFKNNLNDAEFTNKKYAPFIEKEVFESYRQLYSLASVIFNLFLYYVNDKNNYSYTIMLEDKERITISKEEAIVIIEEKQKKLSALSDEILTKLRNYLKSLDVKE